MIHMMMSTCQQLQLMMNTCTAGGHLIFSPAASELLATNLRWRWGGIFGVKVAWTCCCHENVKQSMLSNNQNIMDMNEHVKPWMTNHEWQIMSRKPGVVNMSNHEWQTNHEHALEMDKQHPCNYCTSKPKFSNPGLERRFTTCQSTVATKESTNVAKASSHWRFPMQAMSSIMSTSMSHHVTSCHVMSFHAMSCYVMLCHAMSCHVMSCVSCHVMSCYVMLCHVMSCHVMLCHDNPSPCQSKTVIFFPSRAVQGKIQASNVIVPGHTAAASPGSSHAFPWCPSSSQLPREKVSLSMTLAWANPASTWEAMRMSPPLASRTRHVSSRAIHKGACSSPRPRRRWGREHSARRRARQSPEVTRSAYKGPRTQHIQSLSWHPISPSWSARWTSPQTCRGFARDICALRSPCRRQPGRWHKEGERSTPSAWSWTPHLTLANPGLCQETRCLHHAHHVGKLGASCQDSWPGASGPLSKDYLYLQIKSLIQSTVMFTNHASFHQISWNVSWMSWCVTELSWTVMVMEWNTTHEMKCDKECRKCHGESWNMGPIPATSNHGTTMWQVSWTVLSWSTAIMSP